MRGTKLLMMMALLLLGVLSLAKTIAGQEPARGASPEWTSGNRHAPVIVELFSDYECRRCAAFNMDVKRIQAKYGDRVRMIFREFPLTQIHGKALLAAQAAEAAGRQGKFFEMNDLLYSKANEWKESKDAEEQFISYAHELKLNVKRFRADVSGPRVRERISLDEQRARSLNLPGAPTVVINGGKVLHEDLANLESEIDSRLFQP
jgi:protein-disulfide isomerase